MRNALGHLPRRVQGAARSPLTPLSLPSLPSPRAASETVLQPLAAVASPLALRAFVPELPGPVGGVARSGHDPEGFA